MRCPTCAPENPDAARFCMSCGSPTARKCPSCSQELPAAAAFCFACGAKVGAPASPAPPAKPPPDPVAASESLDPGERNLHRYVPPELLVRLDQARTSGGMQGERRVVTMLFCDVK